MRNEITYSAANERLLAARRHEVERHVSGLVERRNTFGDLFHEAFLVGVPDVGEDERFRVACQGFLPTTHPDRELDYKEVVQAQLWMREGANHVMGTIEYVESGVRIACGWQFRPGMAKAEGVGVNMVDVCDLLYLPGQRELFISHVSGANWEDSVRVYYGVPSKIPQEYGEWADMRRQWQGWRDVQLSEDGSLLRLGYQDFDGWRHDLVLPTDIG